MTSCYYILISRYIENVFPGEFGLPRPPWFPFLPSYWCGSKGNKGSQIHSGKCNAVEPSPDFEDESQLSEGVGVSINNLRKVFSVRFYLLLCTSTFFVSFNHFVDWCMLKIVLGAKLKELFENIFHCQS